MKRLSRIPAAALVLLAVSAIVAGCAEASSTSGAFSLISAGAGLAGYLLFFGAVVAGRPVLPPGDAEDDEEGCEETPVRGVSARP